ncbi:hypothetical protein DICA1_A09428 [Diutina catenulata]
MPSTAELAVIVVLGTIVLVLKYFQYTRDVPALYIEEQSEVEATRLPNESAIHKSNKLEQGLRVGLDIRYDHYKIRHGNLADIWHLRMKSPDAEVRIRDQPVTVAQLNHWVTETKRLVAGRDKVQFHFDEVFASPQTVAVVWGCFLARVTVEVTPEASTVHEIVTQLTSGSDRANEKIVYSPEQDHGVAMRIVRANPGKQLVAVEFTQLNFISATASTLRHLPPSLQMTPDDVMSVVHTPGTNEELTNCVVKMLTACVAQVCRFTVGADIVPGATIASIPSSYALPKTRGPLYYVRAFGTRLGKFIACGPYKVVYINHSVDTKVPAPDLAAIGSRVVVEAGYYNIVGPLIVTDIYDYRRLANFGAIPQSLEIKLQNYHNGEGTIAVRGYTIGRTGLVVGGMFTQQQATATDGFMPTTVLGRFGADGCLFVC